MIESNGRDDWIRTSDLIHPKDARYQAAPRPDFVSRVAQAGNGRGIDSLSVHEPRRILDAAPGRLQPLS